MQSIQNAVRVVLYVDAKLKNASLAEKFREKIVGRTSDASFKRVYDDEVSVYEDSGSVFVRRVDVNTNSETVINRGAPQRVENAPSYVKSRVVEAVSASPTTQPTRSRRETGYVVSLVRFDVRIDVLTRLSSPSGDFEEPVVRFECDVDDSSFSSKIETLLRFLREFEPELEPVG